MPGGIRFLTCLPEKQSDEIYAFSNTNVVIKLSIRPPREHLAVGVPADMLPQDTIEHTHLRGPEKLVRTWVYEEIASDGK